MDVTLPQLETLVTYRISDEFNTFSMTLATMFFQVSAFLFLVYFVPYLRATKRYFTVATFCGSYLVMIVNYFVSMLIDPGRVPIRSEMQPGDIPTVSKHPSDVQDFIECGTCKVNKVKRRIVHCRNCDYCVSNFDHHCPWVGNCIGYRNHKPFILFLLFGSIEFFTITAAIISIFAQERDPSMEYLEPPVFLSVILGIVSGCVGLMITALLGFNLFIQSIKSSTYHYAKTKNSDSFDIPFSERLVNILTFMFTYFSYYEEYKYEVYGKAGVDAP